MTAQPGQVSGVVASSPPADAAARPGRGRPPATAPRSLEYFRNSVTGAFTPAFQGYEVAKCRCDVWFCPDCCKVKGYKLRAELVPIIETFDGLLLVSLTVDPTLFNSPKAAFLYMLERRCVSHTVQDLRRGGCLHSKRYFYVIEWQARTEQAHFHVLLDASFIPFEPLLASWSKHRPAWAGPVVGDRPAFGTVFISKPSFEGGAARGPLRDEVPHQDAPRRIPGVGNGDGPGPADPPIQHKSRVLGACSGPA